MFRRTLEERKEYIARIAARVFCEKGYQTASLQDVAQKGGLSKAGIYHYFNTKEDILSFILLTYTDNFMAVLKSCIQENKEKSLPVDLAFKELINTYAHHLNQAKEVRLLVLRERHQLTGKNKKELLRKEQAISHLLKNELRKIPEINQEYNLNVISFLIISMSHWIGYWFRENGVLSRESVINQSINILFNGMLRNERGEAHSRGRGYGSC